MADIGAGEVAAGVAVAFLIDGAEITGILSVLDDQTAIGGEAGAIACNAGGQHAVEHVHAANDAFHQTVRRTHAHQVAGLIACHMRHDGFQHIVHDGFGLTNAQAADAVAKEVHIPQGLGAFDAQILEKCALHDTEQHLIIIGMVLLAAGRPAMGAVHGILSGGVVAGIGSTHVKGHHDIGTQRVLNIHAHLRRDEPLAAIQMALEMHALFLDLADTGEGEHLKPAAVGKHGLVPGHELMQAARFPDQILTGAQVQVIGIGKHDFRANLRHFPRGHGLDGGYGTHRHIHRGMDVAVRRMQQAQTRAGLLAGFEYFKRKLGGCHGIAPY